MKRYLSILITILALFTWNSVFAGWQIVSKSTACKWGDGQDWRWLQVNYPGMYADARDFYKKWNSLIYLVRIAESEHSLNNTEISLFEYNCKTKKSRQLGDSLRKWFDGDIQIFAVSTNYIISQVSDSRWFNTFELETFSRLSSIWKVMNIGRFHGVEKIRTYFPQGALHISQFTNTRDPNIFHANIYNLLDEAGVDKTVSVEINIKKQTIKKI